MEMSAVPGMLFPKTCVLPDMMSTESVQKQKVLRLLIIGGLRLLRRSANPALMYLTMRGTLLLEDIKERMDDWACKERMNSESAAKSKLDSKKKGKYLREASMSFLRKRKDPKADESESNNEKWMSRSKNRRVTSAFEASFESLKDGVLSSIEDKNLIQEREIDLETRNIELEEKKMKMEIEERATTRETQISTMNAILSLMNTISDHLSKK
jgi:hypothetical protein